MKNIKLNNRMDKMVEVPDVVLAGVTSILDDAKSLNSEFNPIYMFSSPYPNPNAEMIKIVPIKRGQSINRLGEDNAFISRPNCFLSYAERGEDKKWTKVWDEAFSRTKFLDFVEYGGLRCGLFRYYDVYIVAFSSKAGKAITGWDSCIENAIKFIEEKCPFKKKFDRVIVTGHSLGGYVAQVVGKMYNVHKVVTFNALGARNMCTGMSAVTELIQYYLDIDRPKLNREIRDYLLSGGTDAKQIDLIIDTHKYLAKTEKPKKHWVIGMIDFVFGEGEKASVDAVDVPRHTHGVGEKILKYFPYAADVVTNETPTTINYVIAGDPVASVCRHHGEVVPVHELHGMFKYDFNVDLGDYNLYWTHKVGYFLPYIQNDGSIDPTTVRPAIVQSVAKLVEEGVDKEVLKGNYIFRALRTRTIKSANPREAANIEIGRCTLGRNY